MNKYSLASKRREIAQRAQTRSQKNNTGRAKQRRPVVVVEGMAGEMWPKRG